MLEVKPRRKWLPPGCFGALIIPFVLFISNARADDLAAQAAALKVITDAAADLCYTISQESASNQIEISGDVKAKLAGLAAKIAELGIEGAGKYTSVESKGVLQQQLADALAQSSNCRLTVFQLLQEKMIGPMKGGFNLPTDFLDRVKLGEAGGTTLEYIKSILDTPLYEDDQSAHFQSSGYDIFVKFLSESSVNGVRGRIVGTKLLISNSHPGAPRQKLSFSTYFNASADDRILTNATLGLSTLGQFTREDCDIGYIGGPINNTNPQYTCFIGGEHSHFFVDLTFYLDSSDRGGELWSGMVLNNYYEKKDIEREFARTKDADARKGLQDTLNGLYDVPDDSRAAELERSFNIAGDNAEQKRDFVSEFLRQQIHGLRVVGIQINVDGGNLDECTCDTNN